MGDKVSRFRRLEFESEEPQRRVDEPDRVRLAEDVAETWLRRAREARLQGNYENALRYYTRAVELDPMLVEGWIGQVQALTLLDELEEAATWSLKCLERFRDQGDLLAARAQALLRQGAGDEAHRLLVRAFEQPGESAFRWQVRGEVFTVARLEAARACLERAVQLAGENIIVPVEIALALEYYGLPALATRYAQEAVRRDSSSPHAWYVLARVEAAAGFADAARRAVERALQLKPHFVEAQRLLQQLDKTPRLLRWIRRLRGK